MTLHTKGLVNSIMSKRKQPHEHVAVRSDLFEVRPSLGKGLGIFALEDIPVGTRLISEDPVMIINGEDITHNDVLTAWRELSAHRQDQFLNLSQGKRSYASTHGSLLTVKLLDIYNNNCFAYAEDDDDSCICLEASRLNHSCVPNAEHIWNAVTSQYDVYSIFPIPKGEEITIAYVLAFGAMPTSERNEYMEGWNFTCSCKSCTPGDAKLKYDPTSRYGVEGIQAWTSGHSVHTVSDLRRVLIDKLYLALTDEKFSSTEPPVPEHNTDTISAAETPFGWFLLTQLLEAEKLRGSNLAEAYHNAGWCILEHMECHTLSDDDLHPAAVRNIKTLLRRSLELTKSFRAPGHPERTAILEKLDMMRSEPAKWKPDPTDDLVSFHVACVQAFPGTLT